MRLMEMFEVFMAVLPALQFFRCIWFPDWYIDELPGLVRNGLVNGELPYSDVLSRDFWGAHLWDVERATHKSFRPVVTLLWRVVADLVGHVSPFNTRMVSCVGHLFVTLLLDRVLRTSLFSSVDGVSRLLVCMLFAAHPVHVENIVYSVGFADTLATIFMALAFLGCASARVSRVKVLGLCALSALSKESGFVSFAIVWMLRFFRSPHTPRMHLPELLATIMTPILRVWYVGRAPVNFAFVDVPYMYEAEIFLRTLSYLHVHSIYGRLAVLPWSQSWDYSFDAVPLVRDFSDLRMLGSLATYGGVSCICWWAVRKFSLPSVCAVCLFILPFIPASSLFLTVGTVVGERLLYPVTFGLAVLVALFARTSRLVKGLLVSLAPVYIWLGCGRTNVWSSKFSLYSNDALAWPRSCKNLHQYGAVLINSDPDQALSVLEESLRIFDDNALTDYLVSQILVEKGDLVGALARHNKIATGHGIGFTDFSRFMFLVDAGYVLIASGQHSEYAANLVEEGLEIFSWVLHGRNALGVTYLHMGDVRKGLSQLEMAAQICAAERRPVAGKCEFVYSNLAVAYVLAGETITGKNLLSQVIKTLQESGHQASPVTKHNLAWIRGQTEYPRTEIFYERFS